MPELLTKLLQVNLAAGAAILLVLVMRKSARSMFGARTAYALWLLVPLAAAASLAPPRPATLLPAPPAAPAALIDAAEQSAATLWTWGAGVAAPAGLNLLVLTLGVWVVGQALMVAWLALRQAQFLTLLAHGEAGPAVVGFLRPRIVTPSDFETRFDRREQTVILAHEKIHLTRHDARINALVALGRCVCWFNPLVHVAAHLMRVDQELACDATVVERHPKARAPYAQALLKAQLAARPLPLGCYWPAGTEHPLTQRIAMLKRSNPSRLRRLAGVVVVVALSAGAGYAAWSAAPATAPAVAARLTYIERTLPVVATLDIIPPVRKADRHVVATTARKVSAVELTADRNQSNGPAGRPPQSAPTSISRVTYVGSAPIPARQPFVRYYDGNAPVTFTGRVSEVHMNDGVASELMVQADDGTTFRVIGGEASTLSPEGRAQAENLAGSTVTVRGYLAYDQSCERGCIVNGRDVSFPDGSAVISR
jgi:beta-lactamase regulating signal transducer with metallopeptidase domain